jgi:hypothetical protein
MPFWVLAVLSAMGVLAIVYVVYLCCPGAGSRSPLRAGQIGLEPPAEWSCSGGYLRFLRYR